MECSLWTQQIACPSGGLTAGVPHTHTCYCTCHFRFLGGVVHEALQLHGRRPWSPPHVTHGVTQVTPLGDHRQLAAAEWVRLRGPLRCCRGVQTTDLQRWGVEPYGRSGCCPFLVYHHAADMRGVAVEHRGGVVASVCGGLHRELLSVLCSQCALCTCVVVVLWVEHCCWIAASSHHPQHRHA